MFSIFFYLNSYCQLEKETYKKDTRRKKLLKDPLTPSKAAFYSAVVPGLGQIYTKRYWTIPFIYGGLTVSTYYFLYQTNEMNSYRNAYKQRIRGDYSDEYSRKILFNDQLVEGMNFHKNLQRPIYFMVCWHISFECFRCQCWCTFTTI